jgi:hypothetical protein
MNASQKNEQILAETGCRASATAPAHNSLVIENLNEFAAAGVVGACGICIADFVVRESRPAAA